MSCGGEGGLAGFIDRLGGPEVHGCWCVPSNPGVVMDIVVLVEEPGAELAGLGQTGEGCGEVGQVLQGLELAFGEWVVIGLTG